MITEIERQFFDTFEIKPKYKTCVFKYCKNKKEYDCENCNDREWHYPPITDRILLELICILNPYSYPSGKNIQHLKEGILEWCIKFKNDIKHQVQTLFEV